MPKFITVYLLISKNAQTAVLSLAQVRITLFTTELILIGLEEIKHETAAEFKCSFLH